MLFKKDVEVRDFTHSTAKSGEFAEQENEAAIFVAVQGSDPASGAGQAPQR